MNPSVHSPTSGAVPAELAELVERLTVRLKNRESVDLDELVREHPAHADELRRLLPAMKVLAELSGSFETGLATVSGDKMSMAEPLGDFQLLREVGRGGMGVVYEAEQLSLGRRVALKVLPFAATMDSKHLRRFHNEARAAASLHHEHIVPVCGVGCERGVHYYAMQFIDGQTLAHLIHRVDTPTAAADAPTEPVAVLTTERGKPKDRDSYRRIAELIAQAADALEYAHSTGVVHRDVKPGNLMVDTAGKLWVTDFGLARFGADAGLTMTGDLLGTLRYMAPEQALAKHSLVDPRADVYGLGATLYELLTGQPAVGGEDKQEILKTIAFEEPVPPRRLDKSIPAELETIALKCLAKEPAERYATAGEMAMDLRYWAEDRPIRARPPSRRQRLSKWVKRHRSLTAVYALLLLVMILGALAAGAAQLWRTAEGALDFAESARGQTETALDGEKQARAGEAEALRKQKSIAYLHLINLAHAAWRDDDIARARSLLERCPPDLRDWEWRYVHGLCHDEALVLPFENASKATVVPRILPDALSFDTDGRHLRLRQGNEQTIWHGLCHDEALVLPFENASKATVVPRILPDALSFDTDGRHLRLRQGNEQTIWDVSTGKAERSVDRLFPSGTGATASSRDGKRLAFETWQHDATRRSIKNSAKLTVRDLGKDQDAFTFLLGDLDAHWLDFNQGDRLVGFYEPILRDRQKFATPPDFILKVWDLEGGQESLTLKRPLGVIRTIAFSPDGRRLITATGGYSARSYEYYGVISEDKQAQTEVTIWDLVTGAQVQSFIVSDAIHVAFSADGQRFVSKGENETIQVWNVLTGKQARKFGLRGLPNDQGIFVFSPNAQYLAAAAGNPRTAIIDDRPADTAVRVWDLSTGAEIRCLRGHDRSVGAIAFPPEGAKLATASTDKTVRIWDLSSQRSRKFDRERPEVVCFTPDGQQLAVGLSAPVDPSRNSPVKMMEPAVGLIAAAFTENRASGVRILEPSTGQEVVRIKHRAGPDRVLALALSPDGTCVACSGFGPIGVYELPTGRLLHSFKFGLFRF